MNKYTCEYRVIYADIDAMGVIYHSNYIDLFERGRTEFLRKIGYPYSELEKIPVWFPCIEVHCEYKSPGKYDDLLEISCRPSKLTYATVRMEYEIRDKNTNELLVTGYSVHAFTDSNLKPIRVKKVVPEFYNLMSKLIYDEAATQTAGSNKSKSPSKAISSS